MAVAAAAPMGEIFCVTVADTLIWIADMDWTIGPQKR